MLTNCSRREVLAMSFAAAVVPPAFAGQEPSAVMSKCRRLRRGLTNSASNVTMTIQTGGATITRKMRQYVLEVNGAGNRTINVFSSPADVRGISVLTHSALNGNDKQWLYLPSVGRVKRISSSNRSGAFVGSDFAYEDLASFEVEKYSFTSAVVTTLNGRDVIAVTYSPRYSGSGYTSLRAYLDPGNYQPVEIRYFNRRKEHFKTLKLFNYRSYGGGASWRPHRLIMSNRRNGSTTQVDFSPFKSNRTSSGNFNSNRFQRVL